jgi:hypothetical protein
VSPILLDHDAIARDIISDTITLVNDSSSKRVLYATVNEIAVDDAGAVKEFVTPVMTDRTDTITSWIEVTRGRIELEPGETREITVTIRVHPYAKPGEYHAFIGFVSASKRHEAEAVALRGDAEGVIVKVALTEKVNQLLRISGLMLDRFITNDESRKIDIEVENPGDTDVIPNGEIIFYNSRGEELYAQKVNTEGVIVPAGGAAVISSEVPFSNELGRFKANVRLQYGKDQAAMLYDSAQFFMMPTHYLIIMVIAIVLFSLAITYLLKRAFYDEAHDEDETSLPLYIRSDRAHEDKDHDINLQKTK